ncbi:hypothetical protein JD844_022073 [Phrynosoma platyrhinos]|uniref:Cytochrome b5 heme-binding domain-containing protein n=1 Tax=Phrynosoma platyrhinos TaxID=52577 RepID=A0ABQ7SUK2_PHRPL|nr:hypothetical protein JD844_022073 [Phrynosoma platyrhinos]
MPPQSDANVGQPEPGPDVGQLFTWEEIGLHTGKGNSKEDKWLVINRKVYDISRFHWLHPGGTRVISHYAGQDATEMLINDFHELHATIKKMGFLKSNYSFFIFMFLHAFLLDIAAWLTIWYFGKSWVPFLTAVALFTIAQGGPASQWNHMHNQHHAKPNCFRKDPDLNMHPLLFTLGKPLSMELGKKKKKYMPYQYQHKYFCFLAPLTFTIYVQLLIFRYTIQRKKWIELAFILIYNVRVCLMFLESNWFLWVSQMNHIPMSIDYDQNLDWVSAQLSATCNVDQSWFNDWYTGHLNFQIEHQSLKESGEYWQDAYLQG